MSNKTLSAIFGIGLMAFGLWIIHYILTSEPPFTTPSTALVSPVPKPDRVSQEPIVVPDDQLALIHKSHAAFVELAKTSPTAAQLLTFYEENAILGKLVPEGVVVAENPKTATPFIVTADTTPRILTPGASGDAANFDCGIRTMTFNNVDFASLVTGLFVGHETVHAIDCVINGEPDAQRGDLIMLEGERHAYGVVHAILDEHTHGKWGHLVEESRQRRVATLVAQGRRPEGFYLSETPEDVEGIKRIFGTELNQVSLGALALQLTIDAGMINCEVQAEAYGQDAQFARDAQLRFLDALYRQRLHAY